MAIGIKITLNEKLYLRDPQGTELGCSIIKHSILLIDEIGFEAFNFKKLAAKMASTEASIYRYFKNKHLLLIYLVSWYWEWISYLIDLNTMNIGDPERRLRIIIETLVHATRENPAIAYVNESILHRIVIAEGSKAYHTKMIDSENNKGFFLTYKALNQKVAEAILAVNANFTYPNALASNLLEMANNHIYFALHLPRLTNVTVASGEDYSDIIQMLEYFSFKLLEK